MGITNVQAGLEDRIATYKGELEDIEAEIKRIEDGIEIMPVPSLPDDRN